MRKEKIKIKIQKINNSKGFSLIEAVMAMAVFSIVAIAVVAVFANVIGYRTKNRTAQINLENARTALESMAKTIRMSSNVRPGAMSIETTQEISMFNNSENKCVRYVFSFLGLNRYEGGTDPTTCNIITSNASIPIYGAIGKFYVVESSTENPKSVGRATVTVNVGGQQMQTTVSFRDYEGTINN